MLSLYDAREAEQFRERYAKSGADLADRIYTSRLLGRDPSLVLHGGGNTSVKGRSREVGGKSVDVLWVKGSGWDLERIEPRGFSECRLAPLREYCHLPSLSDEAMVSALRSQMLDPSGPTPSVEALLHAHLPGKFVDHTHSDAVLAIVDQADAPARVREVWGSDAAFLPYVAPGFVLAQRVAALGLDESSPALLILEKHGIFTWGASAAESYERMVKAVTRAEEYVAARAPEENARPHVAPAGSLEDRARLCAILRGALLRRESSLRPLLDFRSTPAILQFLAMQRAREVAERGCVTPDHAIRTKPFPAWLDGVARAGLGADAVSARVRATLDEFAHKYEHYFEKYATRSTTQLTRLDALPRIVAVPELGIIGVGKTSAQAKVAADLYEHAVGVMTKAEAIGSYQPCTLGDLFDVEYWSLEQAKLGASRTEGALAGHIALVTGSASGIGLATASHFLALGAHVLLSDRDASLLTTAVEPLAKRFGASVASYVADVTQADQAEAAVRAAVLAFGGLDLVVSNAGSAPSGALHGAEGSELLRQSLELNLLSHQYVARAAAEALIHQGAGGCLLFNASKSAFNPGPMFGPYAVPKAGLVALMKQYSIDLAPFGIRANAVNADRVKTGLFSTELVEARARARGLTAAEYFRANLLQRETLAEDVAKAFAYLATAHATTGAVIPVDGGNAAAFPR